ncbi:hypothetical protein PGT21_007612 [Puccinia graminis f. sp. tritici]|uniref:Uncharacterized protein n=2 Tax=Puccinia graminis f. sp. tritici TaxID=56615 RepID=E3JVZ8_PUCGT|nr:uncharacterized protein PGTG_02664 [Puccinia graminis f. sp. tritici CRL 75-36-700-3]EFP76223.1 hypothetical protein PGTG_02664 [Puccinia graminis f. sp. tritici CRL 75-36-700-3]KAA1117442.1 hypothetical protein PGT21_007612 [Puccinia graminis f. sp. tritici]
MSRFGIDLFARKNPPPRMGYHTDAENYHIHGIGPQPANLTPQMVHCSTTFLLYCPKQDKPGWNTVKPENVFPIVFEIGSLSLKDFQSLVATEANKLVDDAGGLINNAVETGSPRINWKVSLALKSAPEFKKALQYTVNEEKSYDHWIKTMKDLNADHTHAGLYVHMVNPTSIAKKAKVAVDMKAHVLTQHAAQKAGSSSATGNQHGPPKATDFKAVNVIMDQIYALHPPNIKYLDRIPVFIHPTEHSQYIPLTGKNVQIWAHAIMQSVDGVTLHSPPPELKFEKLSAYKKRKLSHSTVHDASPPTYQSSSRTQESESDNSSVVEPDENLMAEYVDFVKIKPTKKEEVLRILNEKDVTNPKFFQSNSITREDMSHWGLTPGIIAQLRDNTKKFEKRPAPQ